MSEVLVYYYIDNKTDIHRFVRLTQPNTSLGDFKREFGPNCRFRYNFEIENEVDG